MNPKVSKPVFPRIVLCVLGLVFIAAWMRLGFVERVEWITYDWRAREAARHTSIVTTNLGFVFVNDESIRRLADRSLGFEYGLYWPRHIYGRLVRELHAQGARVVAFDILFGELRNDHAPVLMEDNSLMESDEFLAWQARQAGNVILAAHPDIIPPPLFRTNAAALGDISADKDPDGVLRKARAFTWYRKWHPLFEKAAVEYSLDLARARIETGRIVLPQTGGEEVGIPVDGSGFFDLADFVGENIPAGEAPRARAFIDKRIWHMGIEIAARELRLNLDDARVELEKGRITLLGPGEIQRIIPVDRMGFFYIDWSLPAMGDARLTSENVIQLLERDRKRLGFVDGLIEDDMWRGKLVVVGSTATGGDLTDLGSTPLERETFLPSKHWNVANSIIMDSFIRRCGLGMELLLIGMMAVAASLLIWRLRAVTASMVVFLVGAAYVIICLVAFVQFRYWVPMVLPLGGGLLLTFVALITYQAFFEQFERRRIKTVFTKIVSPEVVNELLSAERLALGGGRREITVFFADIRDFTEFTDVNQDRAAEMVRERGLSGGEAEACFDEYARETLNTINQYLGVIADVIKRHQGTLDKYIGDCVMAFWGAPVSNEKHALSAVRAAIEAQRAIHELNQKRAAENKRLGEENAMRVKAGKAAVPLQPILTMGTGINTGVAAVGLMGSDAHILNYTVFGREVNLASRLESVSGRGRILIGEGTYQQLRRDEPSLAATCVALTPVTVKGIRHPVNSYEVPWRDLDAVGLAVQEGKNTADEASPAT